MKSTLFQSIFNQGTILQRIVFFMGGTEMYKMNPDYFIGIELMDTQHQYLFELMEKAQTLLKDENILYKYDELIIILKGLEDYTKKHFADEIALMESLNYPRLQLHKEAHQGFIDKLNSFEIDAEKISLGTQDQMIFDLIEYLKEWLQIHILDCDKKVVRFINGENITA